jgi:DNA mismatch repair protein MutH
VSRIATGGPRSEEALLARARAIAGWTLEAVARSIGSEVPHDLSRAKGWVGTSIEAALGATASTRPIPDFPHLNVELKTIPIDEKGEPRESTYVCTASLTAVGEWRDSVVKKKLARVLWIPVEAAASIPIGERRVGSPLLWSPSAEEEEVLRSDFEELAQLIESGWVDSIGGDRGRWLQLRPKAQDAAERTWGTDDEGAPVRTLPRGFYLRRSFTRSLLLRHFVRAGYPK